LARRKVTQYSLSIWAAGELAAAVVIQSAIRRKIALRWLREKLTQKHSELQTSSVINIQRLGRGFISRKRVDVTRRSRAMEKKLIAVIRIQCFIRFKFAQRLVKVQREQRSEHNQVLRTQVFSYFNVHFYK